MLVYLDNCCYNRPYDDQSSLCISLETQAKLRIQMELLCRKHSLVWSSIEDYENAHNPFEIRRNAIGQWRNIAVQIQMADKKVTAIAEAIMQKGNVITVEPGIYLPGKFGVRLEETTVITDTGAEILTRK